MKCKYFRLDCQQVSKVDLLSLGNLYFANCNFKSHLWKVEHLNLDRFQAVRLKFSSPVKHSFVAASNLVPTLRQVFTVHTSRQEHLEKLEEC